jgi:uncharacterized membrane protein
MEESEWRSKIVSSILIKILIMGFSGPIHLLSWAMNNGCPKKFHSKQETDVSQFYEIMAHFSK